MLQSESIAELLAALAEVQSELPTMPKSSQAYGYKYTDLDTITQTIKPILSKHGIGYMQSVGGTENALTLTTRIYNKKGEYIEDTAVLPTITSTKNNAAQTLGMSITYMRRYALCAMLGITSEEDVDANINGTTQTQGSDKPTPPKQDARPKPEEKKPPVEGMTTANKIAPHCTPMQTEEMKKLFASTYPDGTPVMADDEKEMYRAMGRSKSMQDTIASCKKYVADKLAQYKPQTAQKPELVNPIPEEIF